MFKDVSDNSLITDNILINTDSELSNMRNSVWESFLYWKINPDETNAIKLCNIWHNLKTNSSVYDLKGDTGYPLNMELQEILQPAA